MRRQREELAPIATDFCTPRARPALEKTVFARGIGLFVKDLNSRSNLEDPVTSSPIEGGTAAKATKSNEVQTLPRTRTKSQGSDDRASSARLMQPTIATLNRGRSREPRKLVPLKPRASVIKDSNDSKTPSKFNDQLRKYPAPSGMTPAFRNCVIPVPFRLSEKTGYQGKHIGSAQKLSPERKKEVPKSTSTTLTAQEREEFYKRLATPKCMNN